jgi:hypothetical protein
LHTENQLYTLPGSALKVCVVGGCVLKVNLVISFDFGQAEQHPWKMTSIKDDSNETGHKNQKIHGN